MSCFVYRVIVSADLKVLVRVLVATLLFSLVQELELVEGVMEGVDCQDQFLTCHNQMKCLTVLKWWTETGIGKTKDML